MRKILVDNKTKGILQRILLDKKILNRSFRLASRARPEKNARLFLWLQSDDEYKMGNHL